MKKTLLLSITAMFALVLALNLTSAYYYPAHPDYGSEYGLGRSYGNYGGYNYGSNYGYGNNYGASQNYYSSTTTYSSQVIQRSYTPPQVRYYPVYQRPHYAFNTYTTPYYYSPHYDYRQGYYNWRY